MDVVGVGDVCSFAQMDTRRHGNPRWMSKTNTKKLFQAKNGKTELSLIHFAHTNPNWKMPVESIAFMDNLRDQVIRETNDNSINSCINQGFNTNPSGIYNAGIVNSNDNQNNLSNSSLNKSIYHLQSLVYNSSLPSNLLSNYYFKINIHLELG